MNPAIDAQLRRGWNPLRLGTGATGIQWWADASRLPAGACSLLPDLTGKGRNFTESTNKPVATAGVQNGRTVLRATAGSSHKLTCAGSGIPYGASWTLCFVGTASSVASSYMIGGSSNSFSIISRFNGTSIEWYENGATNGYVLSTNPGAGFHVYTVTHAAGGNNVGYIDGVQAFSAAIRADMSAQFITKLFCTSSDSAFSSCDFGEGVLVGRVVNTTDRLLLEYYLKKKWGT